VKNSSKHLLVPISGTNNSQFDIICFPHAGGSASTFRGWAEFIPPDISCVAVQLPGREARFTEKPLTDLDEAIKMIGEALAVRNSSNARQMVFYGHSFGALLAFETTRWLMEQGQVTPVSLVVAARRAPDKALNRTPLHVLNHDEFVVEIEAIGGVPKGILANEKLVRFFLKTLRSDIAMNDTYVLKNAQAVECPITAMCGLDDPLAGPSDMVGWHHFSNSASSRVVVFEGGHFFPEQHLSQLISVLVGLFGPECVIE